MPSTTPDPHPALPEPTLGSTLALGIMGGITGAASQLNDLAMADLPEAPTMAAVIVRCLLGAVAGAAFFLFLRGFLRRRVRRWLPAGSDGLARYHRRDTATYALFLLSMLGAFGVKFNVIPTAAMWLLFLAAQGLLIFRGVPSAKRDALFVSNGWLAFLFLISGFAALIYQISWQRLLFSLFGVNIESVTIIVSIFMFGLGVGSLVGGLVSRRVPERLPHFFFLLEIVIAAFGVASVPLIKWVGAATLHLPLVGISLVVYLLLCLPTMCMGATLPILVEYLSRRDAGIGRSVGLLYCVNTAGSALACFLTAGVLFVFLGLQWSVYVASFCNFLTGLLVFRYCRARAPLDFAAPA